jgi:predicted nucleotidyltransferase
MLYSKCFGGPWAKESKRTHLSGDPMAEPVHIKHEDIQASAQLGGTMVDAPARDELVSKLQRALPPIFDDLPVRLAYLYGSIITGQMTPFSDIDLALVVDAELSPLERLKLTLGVQLDLADSCDIRNADVRIINDAPLVLQGKVVCEGIIVFSRDEQERVEFETATRLRYFDYQPIHRDLQDAFFADLRERGLYG